MIRSAIAGLALVFLCVACRAPAKSSGALRDISGVARHGDTLLLVDDETPGAYFRFPLASPTPRILPLLPDSLLHYELPGSSLFLDAESIAVLGDGRIVVLSERLRGLGAFLAARRGVGLPEVGVIEQRVSRSRPPHQPLQLGEQDTRAHQLRGDGRMR